MLRFLPPSIAEPFELRTGDDVIGIDGGSQRCRHLLNVLSVVCLCRVVFEAQSVKVYISDGFFDFRAFVRYVELST